MKIAVFIKSTIFHKGYGGLETQNRLLCTGLASRGHQITVFAPKKDLNLDFVSEGGVSYIFISSGSKALFSQVLSASWYNKSLEEFTKRTTQFDLVISQSSAGLAVIDNKERLGTKVLTIAHGTALSELKTYYYNNLKLSNTLNVVKNTQYALRQFFGRQRRFILRSSAVVAVSEYVKKQLQEETYIDDSKISVIHNGIVPFEKDIRSIKDVAPVNLIFAGQVSREKGSRLLLQMVHDPRFANCVFHIFGDGHDLQTFNCTPKKTNLKLYGKLSHEDLLTNFSVMQNAVFLFPTNRIEGFPMILVEAMFAGFPVVAFNMGGVADAVQDGHTGKLVQQGKSEIFINETLELVQNQSKRDIIGKSARKLAIERFSLECMLNKYEFILGKLLEHENL